MRTNRSIYYPRAEGEVLTHYNTVVQQLTLLADKYNVNQNTLEALSSYKDDLLYAKQKADSDHELAKSSVQLKNQKFSKAKKELLRELSRITALPNFDEADALASGIRRTGDSDKKGGKLLSVKPKVTKIQITPDVVILDWVKNRMDGVVIYASDDGAIFREIGVDLRSPFEDKRKNKTDQPEVRYYRLRYLMHDQQVGDFSDTYQELVNIQN